MKGATIGDPGRSFRFILVAAMTAHSALGLICQTKLAKNPILSRQTFRRKSSKT